jgi:hypothetical protein
VPSLLCSFQRFFRLAKNCESSFVSCEGFCADFSVISGKLDSGSSAVLVAEEIKKNIEVDL